MIYATHLIAAVTLLGLLAPHWLPALRSAQDAQIVYVLGLLLAILGTLAWPAGERSTTRQAAVEAVRLAEPERPGG